MLLGVGAAARWGLSGVFPGTVSGSKLGSQQEGRYKRCISAQVAESPAFAVISKIMLPHVSPALVNTVSRRFGSTHVQGSSQRQQSMSATASVVSISIVRLARKIIRIDIVVFVVVVLSFGKNIGK